jgi:hypothetical protein
MDSPEMSQSVNTIYLHNSTDWVYMLQYYQSRKLLLVLASRVSLASESRGDHDHILLSHDSESRATSPVQYSKLLLAFASTAIPGFEPRRDPWPYFYTVQTFTCFETEPPIVEKESPFQNKLVVLERTKVRSWSRRGQKPMQVAVLIYHVVILNETEILIPNLLICARV